MAPLGRMYLWFPTEQAMAKVVSLLRQHTLDFESAEGDSLVVDVEWSVLRDLVGPLRRLLTHSEAEQLLNGISFLHKELMRCETENDWKEVEKQEDIHSFV